MKTESQNISVTPVRADYRAILRAVRRAVRVGGAGYTWKAGVMLNPAFRTVNGGFKPTPVSDDLPGNLRVLSDNWEGEWCSWEQTLRDVEQPGILLDFYVWNRTELETNIGVHVLSTARALVFDTSDRNRLRLIETPSGLSPLAVTYYEQARRYETARIRRDLPDRVRYDLVRAGLVHCTVDTQEFFTYPVNPVLHVGEERVIV